jgi:hypothetical protein
MIVLLYYSWLLQCLFHDLVHFIPLKMLLAFAIIGNFVILFHIYKTLQRVSRVCTEENVVLYYRY